MLLASVGLLTGTAPKFECHRTEHLVPDRIQHRVVNGIYGTICANGGGRIGFADAAGKFNRLGQRIRRKVPSIKLAVFAVDDYRFRERWSAANLFRESCTAVLDIDN